MKIRISRKESSETKYWAKILLHTQGSSMFAEIAKEAEELEKIFGSIQSRK